MARQPAVRPPEGDIHHAPLSGETDTPIMSHPESRPHPHRRTYPVAGRSAAAEDAAPHANRYSSMRCYSVAVTTWMMMA